MEKEALVQEFLYHREPLLQACWAHQTWNSKSLLTIDGKPIKVIFPGWLNRGSGPDFSDARIMIGPDEHYGSVEIHVDEDDWYGHQHDMDDAYEKVVLHVVLRGGKHRCKTKTSRELPTIQMIEFLSPSMLDVMLEPDAMLQRYENLPGRCGLRATMTGPKPLKKLIGQAAEERARQKSDRIAPMDGWKHPQQILYEQLAYYLGYQHNADAFKSLAIQFPINEIESLLDLSTPRMRKEILGRWMGAAGLLKKPLENNIVPLAETDFQAWTQVWERVGRPVNARTMTGTGSRPWNSPERRLVGFFYHISGFGNGGLLKQWLGLLHKLDQIREEKDFKRKAMSLLEDAFHVPENEPWRNLISFNANQQAKSAELIGQDRIIILMANAVVPFFLAYARKQKNRELEKLLYRLFIVLPSEGKNHAISFLEKRLAFSTAVPRTLRFHQGLMQIYQDYCKSFDQGCQSCTFVDLIKNE